MLYKILNWFASRVKNEDFQLDESIPISYLLALIFRRFIMIARGLIILYRPVFLGSNVKILCKDKLSLGRSVSIESNCYIDALSHNGITIGDNVSIQKRTIIECSGSVRYLGRGLSVGNRVGIGSCSFFGCAGGIEIGEDTIIGNYVSFHSENHNFSDRELPIRSQGVSHIGIKIGNDCWIGAKVTILDGAIVEDGCIIAGGALLTQGVYSSYSIYGGVPAKLIRKRFS